MFASNTLATIKPLSPPPALEPLAALPELNLVSKLEPLSMPSMAKLDELPSKVDDFFDQSKHVAAAVADRLVSEIVTTTQPISHLNKDDCPFEVTKMTGASSNVLNACGKEVVMEGGNSTNMLINIPGNISNALEAPKEAATETVGRMTSDFVPPIENLERARDAVTNVFETKVKLVEQKVAPQVEDFMQMPEKIINDTIEKLAIELNSVTEDVLSVTDSAKESVSMASKSQDNGDPVKVEEKSQTLEGIIESIPVALNIVAANVISTPPSKIEESNSFLALQLNSLGFDGQPVTSVPSNNVPSNEISNPDSPETNASLRSSVAPTGFGAVSGANLLETEDMGNNENNDGNLNDSCSKPKPGGNKKNKNKNRRNKNKCTSWQETFSLHLHFYSRILSHLLPIINDPAIELLAATFTAK